MAQTTTSRTNDNDNDNDNGDGDGGSKKRLRVLSSVGPNDSNTFVRKALGTLCVGSFVSIWLSSLASPLLLVLCARRGWSVAGASIVVASACAYLPWRKGPVSRAARSFYERFHPCYYESVEVVVERDDDDDEDEDEDLSNEPPTLYAVHPHGAFSFGWALLFCESRLSHVTFCFAPALYASPFFRLFSRLVGRPGSAGKAAMTSRMAAGRSLALPPGGFEEATLTCPGRDRVYVRRRTGFVRLALRHGHRVRPVFAFGERDLFSNAQGAWNLRVHTLNRAGLPALLPWGRPLAPLLPRNGPGRSLRVVVGRPIELPRLDDPTKEQVRKWHDKYVAALAELYENHKEDAYGTDEAKRSKLEIW